MITHDDTWFMTLLLIITTLICMCAWCLQAPESVAEILKPLVALYAMKVIETNLGWYMSEGLLPTQVGAAVPQQIRYTS